MTACKVTFSNMHFSIVAFLCLLHSSPLLAQWAITEHSEIYLYSSGAIAYSENQDGYRLEIYKDSRGIIKSRFIIKDGLVSLSNGICPTYQIDNEIARNGSIDNTPCFFSKDWSEYIIGKVIKNHVNSSVLVNLMDGNTLAFRFRLQNGDYRETSFSLSGSKRSLVAVIGEQVSVN